MTLMHAQINQSERLKRKISVQTTCSVGHLSPQEYRADIHEWPPVSDSCHFVWMVSDFVTWPLKAIPYQNKLCSQIHVMATLSSYILLIPNRYGPFKGLCWIGKLIRALRSVQRISEWTIWESEYTVVLWENCWIFTAWKKILHSLQPTPFSSPSDNLISPFS